MLDEDDTVKDLATKTMEELWFGSALPKSKNGSSQAMDRVELQAKAAIIMGVASQFKDRQSPLEDMLHDIMNSKDSVDASLVHSRYAEICGVLIDGLVDASDLPEFVRTCASDRVSISYCRADRRQLCAHHPPVHVSIPCCAFWHERRHTTALLEERYYRMCRRRYSRTFRPDFRISRRSKLLRITYFVSSESRSLSCQRLP